MSNIYLERLKALSEKPLVHELPKVPKGDTESRKRLVRELPKVPKGAFDSFGSAPTSENLKNKAPSLPDLLARHGGFPGIDWPGLALIDAQESALWVVQRSDGLLTTLATVEPISKPLSYTNAWPARFTTPEPADDTAPAAPAARAAIARARHCTDCALWRTSASRPVCLKGHPLCWRRIGPGGVHTAPSRADTARPCPDKEIDHE
ncbi:hypothetical protein [Thiomonas sp.]